MDSLGVLYSLAMDTEEDICKRYETELATIARLDRRYYLNPCPSLAERRDYAAREAQREAIRRRLYADLAAVRTHDPRQHRCCRSIVQKRKPRRG